MQPAAFADSDETADNDWKVDIDYTAAFFKIAARFDQNVLCRVDSASTAGSDYTVAVFKAAATFDQTVPDSPKSEAAAPLNQSLSHTGASSPPFEPPF